jgi:predicted XRE-type DNA-binding protein
MSKGEESEVVRGSGNVFRDLGLPDADTEKMKSTLAAEIIKALREERLTHAAAAERAGVQRADISRICNVDLDRFTIDRLVRVLNGLGRRIELVVTPSEQRPVARRWPRKKRGNLQAALCSRARISEILNRRRPLSLKMAWRLHQAFGIPAEALIRPDDLASR